MGELVTSATEIVDPAEAPSEVANILNFVNPEWHGAVVGGLVDCSAAVQAAWDTNLPIQFPAGKFLISSPIIDGNPPSDGRRIEGAGMPAFDPRASTRRAANTVLIWGGADGGTMFDLVGTVGLELSSLCIAGRAVNGSGDRAGILVKVKTLASPTYSAGKNSYRNVLFVDAETAVQCADTAGEGNADEQSFLACRFEKLTSALKVNNSQGVIYSMIDCSAYQVTHVAWFANGGNFQWVGGGMSECGSIDADGYAFRFENLGQGHDARFFGLRPEINTRRILRAKGLGAVSISNYTENNASNQPYRMFDIVGCKLSVNGGLVSSYFNGTNESIFAVANNGGGQTGQILLRDVVCPNTSSEAELIQPSDVNDRCSIILERVRLGATHRDVVNSTNRLDAGVVRTEAQTVGAASSYMTFAGLARNYATLPGVSDGEIWSVTLDIFGVSDDGSVYGNYKRLVLFDREDGSTSTQIGATETIGSDIDSGMAATPFSITPHNSYGALDVIVTGVTGKTINWVCHQSGRRLN